MITSRVYEDAITYQSVSQSVKTPRRYVKTFLIKSRVKETAVSPVQYKLDRGAGSWFDT